MTTAIVVFAVTYVLVSARRLGLLPIGRPGAALLGAAATVTLGVLSPERAMAAIDGHTLLLLFGMMGMGAFLAADGFFDRAEAHLTRIARTPQRLLGVVVWGGGVMSALLTNDAVCVFGAPLIVALIRRHGLPRVPFLLALCTAANTGSVATLVGNPQNMLCASLGGLRYASFSAAMVPVALLSLAVNHALLAFAFRKTLEGTLAPAGETRPLLTRASTTTWVVVALTSACYLAGADLAWTATSGTAVLLVLTRVAPDDVWRRVEWSVLLFFAGLFVVVGGLIDSGAVAQFFRWVPLVPEGGDTPWWRLSVVFSLGSNLVSNVPFILVVSQQVGLLADPERGYTLLAMASTFAGNLTLIGSVANVIVAESARDIGGLGFREHLRIGAPVAVVTTLIGTAWLVMT